MKKGFISVDPFFILPVFIRVSVKNQKKIKKKVKKKIATIKVYSIFVARNK